MQWQHWTIAEDALQGLIRRQELAPTLLKRCIEEEITALVALSEPCINTLEQGFREQQSLKNDEDLKAWLERKQWSEDDLRLNLARPEALKRFSEQRFGPGLEEHFLTRKSNLDTALYSLLRVRDPGLARELWIQISEGEISLADAAAQYSDGPEASSRGLLGPMALGNLQPELAERLRHLQPGELRPPETLGPWTLLLRLEKLTPARLDAGMRQRLLQEQMDEWLQDRCRAVLKGEQPEELHYDPPS